MTLILLSVFALLLLGIAFLVIRKLIARTKQTRRPRSRDSVPAHLQQRAIDKAVVRHSRRLTRPQGVTPAGVAVRKAGRSR